MARVTWSGPAQRDLNNVVVDPELIAELIDNAEATLHSIGPVNHEGEGVSRDVMWHRGFTHHQQQLLARGALGAPNDDRRHAWDYFLVYRRRRFQEASFEVLNVVGPGEIGRRFLRRLQSHS